MSDKERKERKEGRRYFCTVCQRPGRNGWYVKFSYGGRRVWRMAGMSKGAAEERAAIITARVKAGLPPEEIAEGRGEISFADFLVDHLKHVEAEHASTTYRDEKSKLNRADKHFSGRNLSEIDLRSIEGFMLKLAEGGASGATRNRYASVLSRLFERAKAHAYVKINPVKDLQRQREHERPVPALSVEEQDLLIASCDDRIRDYVLLSLDTGLRQSEAIRLAWPDVDLKESTLTVRRSKSGKSRTVPLTSRLRSRLKEMKDDRVLPLTGPDRVLGAFNRWNWTERKLYKTAATEAGYPDLRPHDLRHLCAVNLVRAGVPLPDVGRWLGHASSSLSVTMRYARHAPNNAAQIALSLLEARLSSGQPPVAASQ